MLAIVISANIKWIPSRRRILRGTVDHVGARKLPTFHLSYNSFVKGPRTAFWVLKQYWHRKEQHRLFLHGCWHLTLQSSMMSHCDGCHTAKDNIKKDKILASDLPLDLIYEGRCQMAGKLKALLLHQVFQHTTIRTTCHSEDCYLSIIF